MSTSSSANTLISVSIFLQMSWGAGGIMSLGENCSNHCLRNVTCTIIYRGQLVLSDRELHYCDLLFLPPFLFLVFSFSNQLIYTMQTVRFFHMTTKGLHKKRKTIAEHFHTGIKDNSSQRRHIFHFLFARRKAAALEGRINPPPPKHSTATARQNIELKSCPWKG